MAKNRLTLSVTKKKRGVSEHFSLITLFNDVESPLYHISSFMRRQCIISAVKIEANVITTRFNVL